MWQDKVIAVCQMGAVIALVPIIFSKKKPGIIPSVMNVIFPGVVSVTLATLHFYYAMTTAGLISLGWLVISLQVAKEKGASKIKSTL